MRTYQNKGFKRVKCWGELLVITSVVVNQSFFPISCNLFIFQFQFKCSSYNNTTSRSYNMCVCVCACVHDGVVCLQAVQKAVQHFSGVASRLGQYRMPFAWCVR